MYRLTCSLGVIGTVLCVLHDASCCNAVHGNHEPRRDGEFLNRTVGHGSKCLSPTAPLKTQKYRIMWQQTRRAVFDHSRTIKLRNLSNVSEDLLE